MTVPRTLKSYLELYKFHEDPRGDFAREGLEDNTFPVAPKTWEELEGYLHDKRACPEAISAARQIWDMYVSDKAMWKEEL